LFAALALVMRRGGTRWPGRRGSRCVVPIYRRAAGPAHDRSAAAAGSNPLQNPYHAGDNVEPATGSAYLTRSPLRQGMIDPVVRAAFADAGWYWGGNWTSPTDYMHFSANNRW